MSQESSPITQWTDKVDEILYSVENYALANPTKDTNPFVKTQIQAITSATIELIEGLIPKNLDPEAFAMTSEFNRPAPFDRTWNNGYNAALAELRQSLKEMSNE